MSDVPTDCILEILSWVPSVESLLRFRCVCKAWHQIIDGPEFIKLHLHRQTGRDQLMIRSDDSYTNAKQHFFFLSLDSLHYSKTRRHEKIKVERHKIIIKRIRDNINLAYNPCLPVSSCNGVFLFSIEELNRPIWVLFNPFTREFRKLPPYVSGRRVNRLWLWSWVGCGIGYDSVADDYKVVIIHRKKETFVYSLKLNSWKRITDFPGMVDKFGGSMGHGFFLNGALHWKNYIVEGEMCVTALSIETENYRILSVPSALDKHQHWGFGVNLNVLGGCLFLDCDCFTVPGSNGWIMNEYGNSWTKLYSFDIEGYRPIAYLKSQGLVLICRDDAKELFWFDVEEKNAKRVTIRGGPRYCFYQVFQASLVRLNTNGRGGNGDGDANGAAKGMVRRNKKRANNKVAARGTTRRKGNRGDDCDAARGTSKRKRKRGDDCDAARGTSKRTMTRGDDWLKLVLNTSYPWDQESNFKFE